MGGDKGGKQCTRIFVVSLQKGAGIECIEGGVHLAIQASLSAMDLSVVVSSGVRLS